MLTGLVFPDLFGEEIVDLHENFYAHRLWFFALGRDWEFTSHCVIEGRDVPKQRKITSSTTCMNRDKGKQTFDWIRFHPCQWPELNIWKYLD